MQSEISKTFQFHSGSIKRHTQRYILYCACSCFNSIVVRLKGRNCLYEGGGHSEFQFHSGSIKSGIWCGKFFCVVNVSIP